METITNNLTIHVCSHSNGKLFLKNNEGVNIGDLAPECWEFAREFDTLQESDIRWRSRGSGFIIMDFQSPRLKDINRFWVEVKNPETKRFE